MIIFSALWILTFHTGSSFRFFAYKTLMFVSFFFNIFDSFYVDSSIFLLKIALRNPNRTDIMNPNVIATGLILRISRFIKVIVIKFFFLLIVLDFLIFRQNSLRMNVLLFLFVVWTFFWILVKPRICLFPEIRINMNVSPFHGTSFDITQRTWKVNTWRTKSKANITNPAFSRNFGQSNTSLM